MKRFSRSWNRSKKPRKQRKYRMNAPLHIKGKFLSATLSKELKAKYGKNSIRIRVGDSVKVMRGSYKGKSGKVESVDLKNERITISGIFRIKKDGSKAFIPIHPSNVMIIDLVLSDKRRKESLERKTTKEKVKKVAKETS